MLPFVFIIFFFCPSYESHELVTSRNPYQSESILLCTRALAYLPDAQAIRSEAPNNSSFIGRTAFDSYRTSQTIPPFFESKSMRSEIGKTVETVERKKMTARGSG